MSKKFYLVFLFSGILFFSVSAQENIGKQSFLKIEGSYVGDNINNLSGGIKTGSNYLGMASLQLTLDTENMGLWKGGEFFLFGANTHGASPSADLIGDMQVASNIEAGNHTYFQELWFKQALGNFEFTIGLQDLAVEFANTEYGALFLNSSFGVKSTISHNVPVPIFPLTNIGITGKWDISDRFSWLAAAYDGTPRDFSRNEYNTCWDFEKNDGFFGITEVQFNTTVNQLPGTYKVGGYLFNKAEGEDGSFEDIFGLYLTANQTIWERDVKNFGAFAQLGYVPSDASFCDWYLGLGVNYSGLFSKQGKDVIGLAVAHEHFKDYFTDSETAIELTYKYQLLDNLYIQPDFQYIINPAGTGEELDNSFSANIRFGLSF